MIQIKTKPKKKTRLNMTTNDHFTQRVNLLAFPESRTDMTLF